MPCCMGLVHVERHYGGCRVSINIEVHDGHCVFYAYAQGN